MTLPLQPFPLDETKDLVLERELAVTVAEAWRAYTEPELLKQWFCPLPWKTVDCKIDLRPGGCFRTVMRSPEGQEFPNEGCYLEIVPQKRLVFTAALDPGFRPRASAENGAGLLFSAIIELFPLDGQRCVYRATAIHADQQGAEQHKAMGFHQGWGITLDQLVATMQALRNRV